MRKIKFRVWRKPSEVMYFQLKESPCFGLFEGDRAVSIDDVFFYETQDFEIMQYTGLKDKNDKDIFEGDIVTEKYGNEYGVGKVVFEDGAFWVHFHDDEYLLIGCDSEQTEVIGNIYENPELLTA